MTYEFMCLTALSLKKLLSSTHSTRDSGGFLLEVERTPWVIFFQIYQIPPFSNMVLPLTARNPEFFFKSKDKMRTVKVYGTRLT